MDSEEKELLKKLLKKVETLENKLEERDEIIQRIQADRKLEPKKEHPEWGPLPKGDRLARSLVRQAREKVAREGATREEKERIRMTVEELRKNFSFGELARFAIKKRMLREGKESSKVEGSDVLKVYLD